mmetsp:Transcript_7697/g.16923  ORF Transcript_7697/g.16923 Transcript_7697/m.16923 type:complete len:283 (+) Transcript_7697:421-1269(+)
MVCVDHNPPQAGTYSQLEDNPITTNEDDLAITAAFQNSWPVGVPGCLPSIAHVWRFVWQEHVSREPIVLIAPSQSHTTIGYSKQIHIFWRRRRAESRRWLHLAVDPEPGNSTIWIIVESQMGHWLPSVRLEVVPTRLLIAWQERMYRNKFKPIQLAKFGICCFDLIHGRTSTHLTFRAQVLEQRRCCGRVNVSSHDTEVRNLVSCEEGCVHHHSTDMGNQTKLNDAPIMPFSAATSAFPSIHPLAICGELSLLPNWIVALKQHVCRRKPLVSGEQNLAANIL